MFPLGAKMMARTAKSESRTTNLLTEGVVDDGQVAVSRVAPNILRVDFAPHCAGGQFRARTGTLLNCYVTVQDQRRRVVT